MAPHPNENPTPTLRRYKGVICYDDEWGKAAPLGVVALIGYTFGTCAFLSYVCFVSPSRYHDEGFRCRYLAVFKNIKPGKYWWKLAVLGRALLLNLSSVLFATAPLLLLVFLSLLYMGSIALLFLHKPWNDPVFNAIDTVAHLSFAVLLACVANHLKPLGDLADQLQVIREMEKAVLMMPLLCCLVCVTVPIYRFLFRVLPVGVCNVPEVFLLGAVFGVGPSVVGHVVLAF